MDAAFDQEIQRCLTALRGGGTILYPTDTIWGIGCDATNESAVRKIFELKSRPDTKSLVILVDREARVESYIREVPDLAWQLWELSEKPLTLVLPGARNLAPGVIAEDGSVGIRLTRDPFCCRLIERLRKPVVSTSANRSGTKSPVCFSDVQEEMVRGVDYAVGLRREEKASSPSSVIKLGLRGEVEILRR